MRGQLRPICLLPYVYRVWMRMRERHATEWTRKMYGEEVPGPLEEARKLRAQEEVWSTGGGCVGAVFLDVSKCYERVTREIAGKRALESGCHPVATNLGINM